MANIEFSKEELDLLKAIVNDKFAVGAFSGMVFNALIERQSDNIDYHLQQALRVRLRLLELAK